MVEDPPAVREQKTRALIAEISAQRGLAELQPLDISFEDRATFRRSLRVAMADGTRDPEQERVEWLAFGFAPATAKPNVIVGKVLREQVAAFYDPKRKRLHIPLGGVQAGSNAELEQLILAHEIEHGLQDQQFHIQDLAALPDEDTRLALKAVYEGDATFEMMALKLQRAGKLDGASLVIGLRALIKMAPAALASMSGMKSPELDKAPKIVRAQLIFPYFGGLMLFAQVYRAGGYPLMNEVFAHPPASSEQVLHPEKYIAGELPIPIALPALPAGMHEVARGRLGELGIRTMFESCFDDRAAKQASADWGGDAWLISAKDSGELVLQWSTAWDSDAAAFRFRSELSRAIAVGCFPAVEASSSNPSALSAGAELDQRGNAVAVVRGLNAADAAPLLTQLLALPRARLANAPPVGDVKLVSEAADEATIAEAGAKLKVGGGTLANGVWRSEKLGLSATIPDGYSADLAVPGAEVTVKAPLGKAGSALIRVPTPDAPASRKLMVAELLSRFINGSGGRLQAKSTPPVPRIIAGESGEESSLVASDGKVLLKIFFWPGCHGKSMQMATSFFANTDGREQLEGWIDSIHTDEKNPPICNATQVQK